MTQDSIFNLTELFSIMFEKMADCLLRSPSLVNVPFFNVSLLFTLSLLYLCCSILFWPPAVSPSMQGSVLEGRPGWSFCKFREGWLWRQFQTLFYIGPLPLSTIGLIYSPTLPSFTYIFRFAYYSFPCILISCLSLEVHANKQTSFYSCQGSVIAGISLT